MRCIECGQKFVTYAQLHNHYVKDHNAGSSSGHQMAIPISFKCPTCGAIYKDRKNLYRHFRKYPDHRPSPPEKGKEGSDSSEKGRCIMVEKQRKSCKFFFKETSKS